ncbi:hypothetical protein F8M41_016510 [Gigaspora margarita]|uniref:Zn(2)-C6 fungal-type domain-containing protein n=1 Tax=Gigaspora margarita TaxID=4874 RepID=A0A8H4EMP6_GIGMA|nr:hypothetical protein F8M41_016510 [Gigaspora margarita]
MPKVECKFKGRKLKACDNCRKRKKACIGGKVGIEPCGYCTNSEKECSYVSLMEKDPSSSSAYYNDVDASPPGDQSSLLENVNILRDDQTSLLENVNISRDNIYANLQTNVLQSQCLVGPLLLTVDLQLLASDQTNSQTFPRLPGPINIKISEDYQCSVNSPYTASQTQFDQPLDQYSGNSEYQAYHGVDHQYLNYMAYHQIDRYPNSRSESSRYVMGLIYKSVRKLREDTMRSNVHSPNVSVWPAVHNEIIRDTLKK